MPAVLIGIKCAQAVTDITIVIQHLAIADTHINIFQDVKRFDIQGDSAHASAPKVKNQRSSIIDSCSDGVKVMHSDVRSRR